jgi:hypothetical protein
MSRWRGSFRWSGVAGGSGEWCTAGRAVVLWPAVMWCEGQLQQSVTSRLYAIIFGVGWRQGVWPRRAAVVVGQQLIFFPMGSGQPETWPGLGPERSAVIAENSHAYVRRDGRSGPSSGLAEMPLVGVRCCRAAPGLAVGWRTRHSGAACHRVAGHPSRLPLYLDSARGWLSPLGARMQMSQFCACGSRRADVPDRARAG